MFNEVDDIERALESVARKKINNTFIKVFRSSEEQFQNNRYSVASRTMEDVQSPVIASPVGHQLQSQCDFGHLILVKGLPWIATRQEIIDFFGNYRILNGMNGIHFKVEYEKSNIAFIQLAAKVDYQLVLARKVRPMGYTMVTGKIQMSYSTINDKLSHRFVSSFGWKLRRFPEIGRQADISMGAKSDAID